VRRQPKDAVPAHRGLPLHSAANDAVLDSGRSHGVKAGRGGSSGIAMGIIGVGGGSGLGAPVRGRNRKQWFFWRTRLDPVYFNVPMVFLPTTVL
jgi:hypothetical protein